MDKFVPFLRNAPKFESNVLNALHNRYYSTHLPSSNVHWFYATDIPKSKPKEFNYTQNQRPVKFLPFAKIDSDELERVYQTWKIDNVSPPTVAVNEDKLFDCDLQKMEMAPVYWEGPIYEIRRGLWFQDKIPLPGSISDQLEEGYKKLKPFFKKWEKIQAIEAAQESSSGSDLDTSTDSGSDTESISSIQKPSNLTLKADIERDADSKEETRIGSLPNFDFNDIIAKDVASSSSSSADFELSDKLLVHEIISEVNVYEKEHQTKWPLGKVSEDEREDKLVVYKDRDTAYISPKSSTLAKLQIEYLPEVPLFLYIGGSKVKRGYHKHLKREEKNANAETVDTKDGASNSAKASNAAKGGEKGSSDEAGFLSSIVKTFTSDDSNERLQTDLEGDYSNEPSLEQNSGEREIDHVILAVHGIGQSLSSKFSGMNFVHDCNSTRKLMKKLVKDEPKFNNLIYPNSSQSDSDNSEKFKSLNSRTQILPIVWRYNVDFSLDNQFDDLDVDGAYRLPKLEEINVDAVTPIRHLAADVFLDILLYYDPYYKKKILSSVVKLANDIYDKYMERHPDFKGKISLLGHSLGSAVCLDILSQQPDKIPEEDFDPEVHLKFDVENFFGIGSPNGVFKFIKRQNIRPRELNPVPSASDSLLDGMVQSPRINNYYNIFYVTDPVAYRVEPMIHSLLSKYSPPKISYASKNFNSQIQNIGQQFTTQTKNKLISSITGGMIDIGGDDDKKKENDSQVLEEEIPQHILDILLKLNKNGRVDYSLPVSIFDIGVSAIASHTQYFDDPDVAGFIMKELFTEKKEIKSLKGTYKRPVT